MKVFYQLLLVIMIVSGCTAKKQLTEIGPAKKESEAIQPGPDYHDPTTWLLGYFAREQMSGQPHSEWYQSGYDEYLVNTEAVNKLTDISRDNLSIKIVMGTWCPDSRREVPRFMKILDTWNFPPENVTFIGVDEAKLSPVGEYKKLDIQRVPTFIIYKNNVEAGRIIENPVTSLEQDIADILTKE